MSDASKPKVKRIKKTSVEEIELFSIPLRKKKKKETASAEAVNKTYWLETQLKNVDGEAIPFLRVDVLFEDGRTFQKRSNEYGVIRVDELAKPGDYRLEFPELAQPNIAAAAEKQKGIEVVSLDDCFAPGVEELSFSYFVKDLVEEKIQFEILSEHYGDGPIYKQLLLREEREDGEHQLSWDGRFKPTTGPPDETQLLNPLYGPYTLRIATEDGSFAAESQFFVLYHSLELKLGPWTADEKEPPAGKEQELVQYQLNRLGYYGGPVGRDCDDYLKKAIIRYKANHPDFHQATFDPDDYDDAISGALKDALAASDQARELPDPETIADPSAEVELLVESVYYESRDEFPEPQESKVAYEQARINRPLVPLEVEILLRSKGGEAVSAPDAVGPVRVNWSVNDSLSSAVDSLWQASDGAPSQTQDYVRACIAHEAADTGDNCHKDFGGLRDNGESDWHTSFLLGDSYVPWLLEKDAQQKVVFSKAYADDDDYPPRIGRAGAFFRPSYVAGDRYAVTAAIDFAGLPNEEALQTAHGEQVLEKASATFEIRRSAKVALLIEWPGRQALQLPAIDWAALKDEFAKTGILLDVDGMQTKNITDVISADEYRELVVAHTQFSDASSVAFAEGQMMGVPVPEQGSMSPSAYEMHLAEFVEEFWNKLKAPLALLLCQKLRAEHPYGFIVLDFLPHQPLDICQSDGESGETSVVVENHISPGFSTSQPGGFIGLQSAPEQRKAHEELAHEIGHAFWLNHWQHAADAHPDEHDTADDNCVMSLLSPGCSHEHHRIGKSQAHFCGKCNLKLRGWDIQNLPQGTAGEQQADGVISEDEQPEFQIAFFQVDDPEHVGHPGENLERPGEKSVLSLAEGGVEVFGAYDAAPGASAGGSSGEAWDAEKPLGKNTDIQQDAGDGDCGPTCAAFLRYGGLKSKVPPEEAGLPVTTKTIQDLCKKMRKETDACKSEKLGLYAEDMIDVLNEFAGVRWDYDTAGKRIGDGRLVRHDKDRIKVLSLANKPSSEREWVPYQKIIGKFEETASDREKWDQCGTGILVGIMSIKDVVWPEYMPNASRHWVIYCGLARRLASDKTYENFEHFEPGKYDGAVNEETYVRYYCPGHGSKRDFQYMQASLFAFVHTWLETSQPKAPEFCGGSTVPIKFQWSECKTPWTMAFYARDAPEAWTVKAGQPLGELYVTTSKNECSMITAKTDAKYYDSAREADAAAHACKTAAVVVESPAGIFAMVEVNDPNEAVVATTLNSGLSWKRPNGSFFARNWARVVSIRGWLGATVNEEKKHYKLDFVWKTSHRPDEETNQPPDQENNKL
jgi:hypothetical protein